MTVRSLIRLALACVAGLMTLGLGAIVFVYPAAAAAACPSCYGFERLDGPIFVESAADSAARARASRAIAAGRAAVEAFYGAEGPPSRILICASQACYDRLGGGGSRGMALMDAALVLSPRGTDPVIAAHELAHLALHARLGMIATWRRTIPQWFDEGLAVVISGDPRYLAPAGAPERCLLEPDGPMPTGRAAWIERAQSEALYAKAACRVSRWIAQVGGDEGARKAIAAWSSGAPFDLPVD